MIRVLTLILILLIGLNVTATNSKYNFEMLSKYDMYVIKQLQLKNVDTFLIYNFNDFAFNTKRIKGDNGDLYCKMYLWKENGRTYKKKIIDTLKSDNSLTDSLNVLTDAIQVDGTVFNYFFINDIQNIKHKVIKRKRIINRQPSIWIDPTSDFYDVKIFYNNILYSMILIEGENEIANSKFYFSWKPEILLFTLLQYELNK